MDTSEITEALNRGMDVAERVLLRVEELELLVGADRPRRLIDLAQGELEEAVARAGQVFDNDGKQAILEAAATEEPCVIRVWEEFREMLALASRRASEASVLIASRLLAAQDAISALDGYSEYGHDGKLNGFHPGNNGGLLV